MKLVQVIREVADTHESTPAQVALAWLLAQGPEVIPIPGTKMATRMDENAASAMLQLSDEELKKIRDQAEAVEIEGTRYPTA